VYATCSQHPELNVPQQALGKVDMATGHTTTWSRGSRYYTGEPVFVPRTRAAAKAGTLQRPQHEQQGQTPAGQQQEQQQEQQGQYVEHEDDGWLLSLCYDASSHTSELVVLDARKVADGPVATLRLQCPVPHGLHCSWVPDAAHSG
jgi:all-trans-8'-apo-beta-carotenal 15,15'-oxygenase